MDSVAGMGEARGFLRGRWGEEKVNGGGGGIWGRLTSQIE